MTIGELAARGGIAASAIRYYEKTGLLTAPARRGGRRVYDPGVLHQIALIGFAKDTGFTLHEIRLLLRGFPESTPASQRWKQMAHDKTLELDRALVRMTAMKTMLKSVLSCRCKSMAQCAREFANSPENWSIAGEMPKPTRSNGVRLACRAVTMNTLTAFGLFAVSAMLICFAGEAKSLVHPGLCRSVWS